LSIFLSDHQQAFAIGQFAVLDAAIVAFHLEAHLEAEGNIASRSPRPRRDKPLRARMLVFCDDQ
jgi:hypothetical protein